MQNNQRGQPENNNEALGLMANGSSGKWEVSVDETTKGLERWFVQLEGPSVCFSFEIPSPEMIATALEFLEGQLSPKETRSPFYAENGSLILGKHRQTPVILLRDDEYTDRFFLVIGKEADVVVRFMIAGEDLRDIKDALRRAAEDLHEEGLKGRRSPPATGFMHDSPPSVAFLGIVEHSQQIREEGTSFFKWNLLGLKTILISPIFPLPFALSGLAFAFYELGSLPSISLHLRSDTGEEVGWVNISLDRVVSEDGGVLPVSSYFEGGSLTLSSTPWTFMVLKESDLKLLIPRPGIYNIVLRENDKETLVGQMTFCLVEPEPLTDSRKAAIRSNPSASKAVRAEFQCKMCQGSIKAYAGLERVPELEGEEYVWYENLPETYSCPCGSSKVNLSIWRRNFHGLLGLQYLEMGRNVLVPLYEKGALKNIYANFSALLSESAREEIFQKFIEENPVLLHQFTPTRIKFKAPILSLRKTDFAIVNRQHELILIEIEKPDTRLLKADGNIHSELQHALGQALEWLHHSDEHRLALLDCMGVERKEVGAVRAVVIAGRDAGYKPEHLRRLKGDAGYARIKVMTYDDLLTNFGILVQSVESL